MNSIKTKKCILRPPSLRDVDSIARYANDKTIARNMSHMPHPYTKKHAREWIRRCQRRNRADQPRGVTWMIEIGGVAIGVISLARIQHRHKAELGYWLGKPFRGQGIIPTAILGVLRYAKRTLHLKVVYAYAFTHNPASGRALEKAGFSMRGVLPKFTKKEGQYIDDVIYTHVL